jgi:DNA-binding GntR family transcriptional regulator
MANSVFLKPTLGKLLIDHARIGYTFFRPTTAEMEANLAKACEDHDQFIEAIAGRDEAAVVRLVYEHWELSRRNMELFIAPKPLRSDALKRLGSEPRQRRSRERRLAKA